MTGIKHDSGKPDMSLLPTEAMVGLARVLEFGAQKYGRYNYRGGMEWSRLVAAALRHLTAWNGGEDTDAETGLSHIDHALACLSFLSVFEKTGTGRDDRFRKQAPPEPPAAKEPEIRVGQSWRDKQDHEYFVRIIDVVDGAKIRVHDSDNERRWICDDVLRTFYTLVDTTLESR